MMIDRVGEGRFLQETAEICHGSSVNEPKKNEKNGPLFHPLFPVLSGFPEKKSVIHLAI